MLLYTHEGTGVYNICVGVNSMRHMCVDIDDA